MAWKLSTHRYLKTRLNRQGSQGPRHTANSGRHKSHDRGKETHQDHMSADLKMKMFQNKI